MKRKNDDAGRNDAVDAADGAAAGGASTGARSQSDGFLGTTWTVAFRAIAAIVLLAIFSRLTATEQRDADQVMGLIENDDTLFLQHLMSDIRIVRTRTGPIFDREQICIFRERLQQVEPIVIRIITNNNAITDVYTIMNRFRALVEFIYCEHNGQGLDVGIDQNTIKGLLARANQHPALASTVRVSNEPSILDYDLSESQDLSGGGHSDNDGEQGRNSDHGEDSDQGRHSDQGQGAENDQPNDQRNSPIRNPARRLLQRIAGGNLGRIRGLNQAQSPLLNSFRLDSNFLRSGIAFLPLHLLPTVRPVEDRGNLTDVGIDDNVAILFNRWLNSIEFAREIDIFRQRLNHLAGMHVFRVVENFKNQYTLVNKCDGKCRNADGVVVAAPATVLL
jgi:hypothetical protein